MSDEAILEQTAFEIPADIQEQLNQLETIKQENQRLIHKIEEANKHKKEAERITRETERQKAESEGNFEQLYKSSEQRAKELFDQIEQRDQINANEKRISESLRIASQLAEGDHNIDLLAEQVAKRLKYVDNSIKVVDSSGNLTVSTLDDLKKEIAGSARFSSLLKGNKSSGGSATGGASGSGAAQTIRRADFDALDAGSRMKFIKSGGKITD
mgnify:CR=1 FL=1|tara:strand:+ start:898 stop:1536 length:639 start_codon:yes stop_codon:yes gene_type:complete